LETAVDAHAPEWFGPSQAAICAFAGLALLSFWIGGVPEARPVPGARVRRDPGIFWLAAAVLAWAVLGVWTWSSAPAGPAVDVALAVASTINNGFFWLAVAHLDHGPARLKVLQPRRAQALFLGGVVVAAAAIGVWTYATRGSSQQLPDLVLSIATLAVLGWALAVSFARRGFHILAALACVAVASQVAAQWRLHDYNWALILVSKTLTLTTFLALAMSWAHERARLSSLGLRFTGRSEGDRIVVEVNGERRLMTPEVHRRLLVFAVERVRNATQGGGMLNIKEKGIAHTHIARIVEQLEFADRSQLFDNDGRSGYRLKLDPRNIGFDLGELGNHAELRDLLIEVTPALEARRRAAPVLTLVRGRNSGT
jgi:hypothetical protein